MELKYINTFKTIVETGSFTKTAEKLNYTQSTITFQIGQLEQEFSVKLFEKIGRNMMLTKAGEKFLPYADDVVKSAERLKDFGKDVKEYREELKIGCAESVLCYKLPEILRELHKRAPEARLLLQSMNCYDIRDGLICGDLDLGVFYKEAGGFGSSLTAYEICRSPLVLAASHEFKEGFSDFITEDRVLPHTFIINEKNCVFRQIFEDYLRKKSIVLEHTTELWSIPTIKNLVKNNMGFTYLPEFTLSEEVEKGELVEIPTEISGADITAVCAHHKNKWLSPLMKLFINLCQSRNCG
ncbi:MAG: LysR family transcriptional regulator [Clostridiales bacterium]|nr:LysR family transcriptional regulator [Clostridiales bacterium]